MRIIDRPEFSRRAIPRILLSSPTLPSFVAGGLIFALLVFLFVPKDAFYETTAELASGVPNHELFKTAVGQRPLTPELAFFKD